MKNVTLVQIEKGATNMFQNDKECNIGSKGNRPTNKLENDENVTAIRTKKTNKCVQKL